MLPLLPLLGLLAGGGALAGTYFGSKNKQGNALTGYNASTSQLQRYTPQQQLALNQLLKQGLGNVGQQYQQQGQLSNRFLNNGFQGLQNLNQLNNVEPIINQARTGFNQQTVPSIAERFTSMGSGNSLSSPAFASQLGQAGAGLEGQLAALRAQYQNQVASRQQLMSQNLLGLGAQQRNSQQGLLQSLLSGGLSQQFDYTHTPRSAGLFETALPSVLSGLALYGAGGLGGLGGAAASGAAASPFAIGSGIGGTTGLLGSPIGSPFQGASGGCANGLCGLNR